MNRTLGHSQQRMPKISAARTGPIVGLYSQWQPASSAEQEIISPRCPKRSVYIVGQEEIIFYWPIVFHSKRKCHLFKTRPYTDSFDTSLSNSCHKRHPPQQLLCPLLTSCNQT